MLLKLIVAMTLGAVLLGGATITGKKAELCERMGGTYNASAPDQCPDGKWSNILKAEK